MTLGGSIRESRLDVERGPRRLGPAEALTAMLSPSARLLLQPSSLRASA
jgi:hypothetical protein